MRPGDMPHRVKLQSPTGSRDALGERVTTWTDVATVNARVRPLSGKELMVAGQQQSAVSHVVEIRHSSEVSAINGTWRVLFGTRVMVVESVVNPEESNEKLMLYCVEGLRSE